MTQLAVTVKNSDLLLGLRRYIRNIEPKLDEGVLGAALEVGNRMKALAPKAFTTLVNSIKPDQLQLMQWRVAPHVDYASDVEFGTQGGAFVPYNVLDAWVRVRGIQPDNPEWDRHDLINAIQHSILMKGSQAQPFAAPVIESGFAQTALNRWTNIKLNEALSEAGL